MQAARLSERESPPSAEEVVRPDDAEQSFGERNYFVHLRADVLAMVPETARAILSVGCGSGRTEAELVRRGCRVTGIELDEHAAEAARANGLEVLTGDVNRISAQLKGREFDCLIYADVLEHIADPVAILRDHVALLAPGGGAIISVPNFRHYECFVRLFLKGDIRYEPAGIFDETHLRITTVRLVRRWLSEVGLQCEQLRLKGSRRLERLMLRLSPGPLKEIFARQIVLFARKPLKG